MADYQIFADATADLCPALLEGLPQIQVIPMDIEIGGQWYLYGPGGNLNIRTFYDLQRAGSFANTSQIPPGVFFPWFEPVLQAGQDLIYFPLTTGLSGTFQSAQMCIEDLREQYPERTILCVDTYCASVGQGFLLREAVRKKAEGYSIRELAAWVQENSLKVCHWFTVDVFDHLRHGGRVSGATAVLGTALHIKPMLHVNEAGRLEVVGHGDGPEAAAALQETVLAAHPDAEIIIAPSVPSSGPTPGRACWP